MPRSQRHGDHLPRCRAAATALGRVRLQAVQLQLCRHGQVLRRLASNRLWLRAGDTALWLIMIVHCLSFLVYVFHQVLRKRDRSCHSGGRPALVDRCDELHNGGVLTARRAAPRLWGGSTASTGVSRAPRSCHQDQLLIKSERATRVGGEDERAKADSEIIEAAKLAKNTMHNFLWAVGWLRAADKRSAYCFANTSYFSCTCLALTAPSGPVVASA